MDDSTVSKARDAGGIGGSGYKVTVWALHGLSQSDQTTCLDVCPRGFVSQLDGLYTCKVRYRADVSLMRQEISRSCPGELTHRGRHSLTGDFAVAL